MTSKKTSKKKPAAKKTLAQKARAETKLIVRDAEPSGDIATLIALGRKISAKNETEYRAIADVLPQLKAIIEGLEAKKEKIYRPLKTATDELTRQFKAAVAPYATLDKLIRSRCSAYTDKRFEKALVVSNKRVAEAKSVGNTALAASLSQLTEAKSFAPEIPDVTITSTATYSMVDESLLPRTFLMPDKPKISKLVKATPGEAEEMLNGAIKVRRISGMRVTAEKSEGEG